MKKFALGIAMFFSLIFILTACSKAQSTDERFISSLQQGLESRWQQVDKFEGQAQGSTTAAWNTYIDSELNKISEFKDATFENQDLGNLAKEYIESLEKIKENTNYIDTNYSMFTNKTNQYILNRYATLVKINEISPLEFNEKDKANFEGLLNEGKLAIAAEDIMKSADFQPEPKEYEGSSWTTYSCIVENTSDFTFKSFQFNIDLLDNSGVIVDTVIANLENWVPGTKQKASFSTDVQFAEMEINNCTWYYQ